LWGINIKETFYLKMEKTPVMEMFFYTDGKKGVGVGCAVILKNPGFQARGYNELLNL
jgi:hypothetical protein